MNTFFDNILEHYQIVKSPKLQSRILNLVLSYPEIKELTKIRYFEKLIDVPTHDLNINLLLAQAENLGPDSQRKVTVKLMERLIKRGEFEVAIETCHKNFYHVVT